MNGVDLNRFQFDYDTTWAAFFLDDKFNVYSRYGGRDAGEPEARLNKQALLQTMREVLSVHKQRKLDVTTETRHLLQPVERESSSPDDIPLLKKNHRGCLHCHQIREYRLLQWAQDGVFDRQKLFVYPLPENLGIHLDRKHGHRIAEIRAGSTASTGDLRPGDVIDRIADVPIHSELDIRWALHRLPAKSPLSITISRASAARQASTVIRVVLQPAPDWRITDLSWRKSQRSVPLPFGLRGYSLTRSQRKEFELLEDELAIRVVSVQGGLGSSLGLQKRDVIISVAGARNLRTFEQFKSDLLRHYAPGQLVRLTVKRDGRSISLNSLFPDWQTDETSVP